MKGGENMSCGKNSVIEKLSEKKVLMDKILSAFDGNELYVIIDGQGKVFFNKKTLDYLNHFLKEEKNSEDEYIVLDGTFIVFSHNFNDHIGDEFDRIGFSFKKQHANMSFSFLHLSKRKFEGTTKNKILRNILDIPEHCVKIFQLFPCPIKDDGDVEEIDLYIHRHTSEKIAGAMSI